MTVNGVPLVSVRRLTVEVQRNDGWLPAARDVSFELARGERVALVGESGSGKSLTALALGALLPPGARVGAGAVVVDGVDVTAARPAEIRRLRGRLLGFVFQNPMASLDPLVRVGRQIAESLEAHGVGDVSARRARAIELLEQVGVRDARARVDDYPHQFSGGMRQRVMIASALAAAPSLLVADEPTTALDVTVQEQILSLLDALSRDLGLGVLLITHDLAVARQLADRVLVMYGGRILEDGPVDAVVEEPDHPYTQALLRLVPDLDDPVDLPEPIRGAPAPAWEVGDGCPFAPRCPYARPRCREPWRLLPFGEQRASACVLPPHERSLPAVPA